VTGDPKRIEDVLKRVDGLVRPIENVKAEPFELKSPNDWRTVMHWFDREVQAIEGKKNSCYFDPNSYFNALFICI